MAGSQIAHAPTEAPEGGAGDMSLLRRAEVRDVLAWMRLLVNPLDAAAIARALARPPVELRQVDLARVIQAARRRRGDLVLGLDAAVQAPQVPPEARERVARFLELHGAACADLAALAPEPFLARLIERLSPQQPSLLAPEDAAAQSASLAGLRALAADFVRERPWAGTAELIAHLIALSPAPEEGEGEPIGAGADEIDAELAGEQEQDALEALLRTLREELLASVARIGGRLGELRLDTDLDISHGVVRYLELLKLSALLQRRDDQSAEDALADINARLLAAATPLQREILQSSPLDEALLDGGAPEDGGALALGREEHSLTPFLPRKGVGLALSASDIQTYRSCPQRYKYARVLRIPVEQTVHQRFGIVVHQVLERYHAAGGSTLEELLELLEGAWRRSALGEGAQDLALLEKARAALTRYHARLGEADSEPVWFERAFSFRLGPHHLRGRVDRVDRIAGADGEQPAYELIDYKTSRPKSAQELDDDVQLSLYAIAAREDWGLQCSRQSYYYVLDDEKVRLSHDERDAAALTDTVLKVGEGILAQSFEPTPAPALCAMCDYRVVCPAASL